MAHRLISVTEALGPFSGYHNVPAHRMDLAAERGKEVHRMCAYYAAEAMEFQEPEPSLVGYFRSFKDWWDFAVEMSLGSEMELRDEGLGFLGHPDLVVKIKGDKYYTVIDLKTPIALQKVWAAQLSAYKHLADKQWPGMIKRIASLRLDKRGGLVKFKDYTDDRRDFTAFLSALNAYRFFLGE